MFTCVNGPNNKVDNVTFVFYTESNNLFSFEMVNNAVKKLSTHTYGHILQILFMYVLHCACALCCTDKFEVKLNFLSE